MLQVKNLKVFHGLIEAVHGINLVVPKGQCVALLGPNGAGKTSTISAITGVARSTGVISFDERPITEMSTEARIKDGISVSPEGRRVFANLTVEENLVLGGALKPEGKSERIAYWYKTFPILGERRDQMAGTLSGGEQQMLAIARALMTNPKLLILDEATEGLAPMIREEIWATLRVLKAQGQAILVIDKNVRALLDLADRHYMIEKGQVVWSGRSDELRGQVELQHKYLGV